MVFEKNQEIVAEELGKEKEEIKLNTNIQEDLEADSLDLFQIINEIEAKIRSFMPDKKMYIYIETDEYDPHYMEKRRKLVRSQD